jgi:hypothetical protein
VIDDIQVIGRIIPRLSSSSDAHAVERIELKREAGSRREPRCPRDREATDLFPVSGCGGAVKGPSPDNRCADRPPAVDS